MAKASDKIPKKKAKGTSKNQLLGVIAQVAALQGGKAPREMVAKRAGYGNASNGSFKKALSRAFKLDHVDLSDKLLVRLTEKGMAEAGEAPDLSKTAEEIQAKIMEDLTPAMKKVYELIKDGKTYERTMIAENLEYKTDKEQGFKKLLSRIRDKGYLEFVDKERVRLSDLCFPAGRDTSIKCDI